MTLKELMKKRKLCEEKIIQILEDYEREAGSEVFAVGFVKTDEGIKIIINNGYY